MVSSPRAAASKEPIEGDLERLRKLGDKFLSKKLPGDSVELREVEVPADLLGAGEGDLAAAAAAAATLTLLALVSSLSPDRFAPFLSI